MAGFLVIKWGHTRGAQDVHPPIGLPCHPHRYPVVYSESCLFLHNSRVGFNLCLPCADLTHAHRTHGSPLRLPVCNCWSWLFVVFTGRTSSLLHLTADA